ncbi:hypothetical protein ACGFY8_36960 [Streptomyces sp. NPDC048232]|uniref:hypothetical protein n=1 Tax=Streptomyces sp. NPDC048232 TaxID=3365520 RepID=UPI00371BDD72
MSHEGQEGNPTTDFPPVINGLDFLESTVELLTKAPAPSARDQKYAVVHLAAAFEVILKARLEIEEPALTWVMRHEFNEAKHRVGDFKSVQWEDTLKRIRQHCAPETPLIEKPHVRALVEMRNRIAHFGFAGTTAAVEVVTTPVLDFLVSFVHGDLLALVPDQQVTRAEEIIDRVRPDLGKIGALVKQRLATAEALDAAQVVRCLVCAANSVPIEGGDLYIACVVCHTDFGSPADAAWIYSGTSAYEVMKDGGDDPVHEHNGFLCPGGAVTRMPTGKIDEGVEATVLLCLTCGEECAGVCQYCDRAVTTFAFPEADMCGDCLDIRMEKF